MGWCADEVDAGGVELDAEHLREDGLLEMMAMMIGEVFSVVIPPGVFVFDSLCTCTK